jgi:hypothetical protein
MAVCGVGAGSGMRAEVVGKVEWLDLREQEGGMTSGLIEGFHEE